MMANNSMTVDYIVYEGTMSRMERTVRRLWILAIILIVLLVGTNIAWLIYESQFEYFTITQEAESDNGGNVILNGAGDLEVNGKR